MFFWIKKVATCDTYMTRWAVWEISEGKKTKKAERNINSHILKEQQISQMLEYNKFKEKSFGDGKKAAHIRKTPKLQIVWDDGMASQTLQKP